MNPPNSNLRAFNLAVSTLLKSPAQFLPHLTIPTITHLPEQIGPVLASSYTNPTSSSTTNPTPKKPITIRALILDKDNTLCAAKTTSFPPQILNKLTTLRTSPTSPFNMHSAPHSILIVSNRAGSHPRYDSEITELQENGLSGLRIPVFRLPQGSEKKPFCGREVLAWFTERGVVKGPEEIAVVGDRLGTDVLMAAQMGAWSVWCRDGVTEGVDPRRGREDLNVLEKMEAWLEMYLLLPMTTRKQMEIMIWIELFLYCRREECLSFATTSADYEPALQLANASSTKDSNSDHKSPKKDDHHKGKYANNS
ncbi:phosphatidylglycerophosphatase [Aspergillus affinis]|uniref:phosphatidylglycerophosphatase n=1 Tax=Aspergillus affinis TaxID=1070780 RepID=UPI0022FE522E|nr:putative hydrolase [Aspergillus affinis]KAI9035523.1 putative hydrolase [Aspergillus affinis]